jgi:hypothetical protein
MSAPWAIIGVIFFMSSGPSGPKFAEPEDQAHSVESTWSKFVEPVKAQKAAAKAAAAELSKE